MLFLEWLGCMLLGTVVFTAIRVAIYDAMHQPEPGVAWAPWSELPGMYALSPLGWAIMGLLGPAWIAAAGLFFALKSRSRIGHLVTIVGTAFFGACWPSWFWAWMSV